MATSKDLERKAERVRERLSDKLSDLRYHASPSTVVTDLLAIKPGELTDELMPTVLKQARGNPVAFGLIAAGLGWLVFSELREPIAKLAQGATSRGRSRPPRGRKRRATNSSRGGKS